MSGSPTVSVDDASRLRVALARLYRALRARDSGELTASQTSALARIENAGSLRLGSLAELEGTSAPTMSRVVDSLIDASLVVRESDPLDGRATMLRVSDQGASVIAQLRSSSTQAVRQALSSLPADDRKRLLSALAAIERLADEVQATPRHSSSSTVAGR